MNGKIIDSYVPDLTIEDPDELAKVRLLEEAVQKGNLKDLTDVLEAYQPFKVTARALGIAARYRGIDYVRVLMEHGATFCCDEEQRDWKFWRSLGLLQRTTAGYYRTECYLMIIPQKIDAVIHGPGGDYSAYLYTALCGVENLSILPELKLLSIEERIEAARFFQDNSRLGVSMDEMLFWALTWGEIDFADALIEMGVTLQDTPPSYYLYAWNTQTYLSIITEPANTIYWNHYVDRISSLEAEQILPVLMRLHALAHNAGKKLAFTQKMFDGVIWDGELLTFVVENVDLTRVNKRSVMENAVSQHAVSALAIIAEAGWLNNTRVRENLISFAQKSQCYDSLAWLMDFKNRTVDVAAEEATETAKMLKALTERPDSVSALKKIWSYKKLKNGSLEITDYKGDLTEVEIPAMIGKSPVTVIGECAFSGWSGRKTNTDGHKRITSVVVPKGVAAIGCQAFAGCESLEKITLPTTLRKIGREAFAYCSNLHAIAVPKTVRVMEPSAFEGCKSLENQDGFIIINGKLMGYEGKLSSVCIPEGVKTVEKSAFASCQLLEKVVVPASVRTIGQNAFEWSGLEEIELTEGLQRIGQNAFAYTRITEIRIPETVTSIGGGAFCDCRLKNLYIPSSVTEIGKDVLGQHVWCEACVHTPTGSVAERYMRQYSKVHVVNDYPEE